MELELEDLIKRLDWLEKEHRKDHSTIAELQEKLAASEGKLSLIQNQVKEVGLDVSRFSSTASRLDQFDTMVTQYRGEVARSIDEVEKRRLKHEREMDERRRIEVDNLNKSLLEIRNSVEALQELRRGIQARVEEDARLNRGIAELEKKIKDFSHVDEDLRRDIRLAEEARKQDTKRIADIQGDLSSIRKRSDEAREKSDLTADTLRQLDSRINELMASESDRRVAQMAFIEQQNLSLVERDRGWKDMQARFESFIRQTFNIDQQLLSLEETQRSVKRSQEAFEDINTRLERRINEITEIQRLAEERFRQEWVTFKADDQKRWTNYSLTQDELTKDIRVEIDKQSQRITAIDDVTQSLQDLIQQTTETTQTELQELMNWAHEFLTNYERILGRGRPTR